MKYTVRHIRKFIEQGKIDPHFWSDHFPAVLVSKVPDCSDCEDYKKNICKGGRNPVDCFVSLTVDESRHAQSPADNGPARKKSKIIGWAPNEKGKKIPTGANKTFDQSKM
jgi:hypothetical protein